MQNQQTHIEPLAVLETSRLLPQTSGVHSAAKNLKYIAAGNKLNGGVSNQNITELFNHFKEIFNKQATHSEAVILNVLEACKNLRYDDKDLLQTICTDVIENQDKLSDRIISDLVRTTGELRIEIAPEDLEKLIVAYHHKNPTNSDYYTEMAIGLAIYNPALLTKHLATSKPELNATQKRILRAIQIATGSDNKDFYIPVPKKRFDATDSQRQIKTIITDQIGVPDRQVLCSFPMEAFRIPLVMIGQNYRYAIQTTNLDKRTVIEDKQMGWDYLKTKFLGKTGFIILKVDQEEFCKLPAHGRKRSDYLKMRYQEAKSSSVAT